MRGQQRLDVSGLPEYAYGARSILWWGTIGFCLIEGTAFVLAVIGYFYLRGRTDAWTPDGIRPPDLLWGTLNTAILLASCIPNELTKKAAEREEIAPVRLWLVVGLVFGFAFNAVRGFEFGALNVRWDTNAYGSIVWTLLSLHTLHIVTDVADTAVLTALMFTAKAHGKRFVDVSENSFYWYFVVLTWLPLYAVIYLAPRVL
jgi:cytochrome c oxidase subunit I+III